MTTLNIKNPTDFANALLGELGLPDTQTNVNNIVGWENSEGGNWHNTATFNPLDTTQQEPGSHVMGGGNSSGVQAYTNWQQGLDATVQTLQAGDYGYPGILSALNTNQGWLGFRQSVENSAWGGVGNKYLSQFPTPPGVSTPQSPNSSTYQAGVTANQQSGSIADTPLSNNKTKTDSSTVATQSTGFAGILQGLDAMYSPGLKGPSWNPLTWLTFIPNDIESVSIEIFTRAASSILMVGVIGIGIVTVLHGQSSGGSSGSATNVLEFVNNAQTSNRKMSLNEDRLKASLEKEADVRNRHDDKLKQKEKDRNAHERRSRRFAERQEQHAANKQREHDLRASGNWKTVVQHEKKVKVKWKEKDGKLL